MQLKYNSKEARLYMGYEINWSKIENSYEGFEKLAVRYVQKEYNSNFESTSATRDGNKDAYTIILGYKSSPIAVEEWWMEAKYSETTECLTRYRLDATIVSALLKGNVGRIIFVTNINVNSQTINDIRQAITATTICKTVNFCTRDSLEYWLYQNPRILKDFFPDYQGESFELPDLVLVDPMSFFAVENSGYIFKESLRILDLNVTYKVYFTVYSKTNQTISLKSGSGLKGIANIKPSKLDLHTGINFLQFSFTLKSNYGYKSIKKQDEHNFLPEPSFILGTLVITCKDAVTVNKNSLQHIDLPSQNSMIADISSFSRRADKLRGVHVFYLFGQSGVGKSYVLDSYIKTYECFTISSFLCEMNGNYQHDLNKLVHCINYVYFPFLPSDNITWDYIKKINPKNYLPNFYHSIISADNNVKALSELFFKYISENASIFPERLHTNPRQIIIDNIHKANNLIINVLYKIVIELSTIGAQFKVVFSGLQIQHTDIYQNLISSVDVQKKELRITVNDCLFLLPENTVCEEIKLYLNSNQLFSNFIELLIFALYLREHKQKLEDIQKFKILYNLFFQKNIMDQYIQRLFMNATHNDDKADELCNKIYWHPYGIARTDKDEEHKLLCHHVIKLDSTAKKVIPYHDVYAKWYRKHNACKQLSDIPFVQLLESGHTQNIQQMAERIHEEYKRKNYIVVYYTLEPIFKDETVSHDNYLDKSTYYTLFQDFAHSCAFCSIDYSGAQLFSRIYNETKLIPDPSAQIRSVKNATLWELTNSTFESLDYELANKYCDELLKDTQKLINLGIMEGPLENNIYFHHVNVIKSMIKSELLEEDWYDFYKEADSKMNGQEERLWSYRVRYSLTLLQRAPHRAIEILSQCKEHYEESDNKYDKYYLWTCFYLAYTKMIVGEDAAETEINESEALSTLEKVKDVYYNDYRKMVYGVILYLYFTGETQLADLYLLKDCHVLREKRPRLKGFECLVNSFRSVIKNENSMALDELKKAYDIFQHIPSYGNLIQHNINVLESTQDDLVEKISYYLDGQMEEDTYYLEIRGCW